MPLPTSIPSSTPGGVRSDVRLLPSVDSTGGVAVCVLDSEGRVASWSAGAGYATGYAAPEIVGQYFSCFYIEEDRLAGLPEHALRGAVGHGRFETDGWRLRKDGTRYWAHPLLDAIRDQHGALVGFTHVTRDLGETRRAAETLRKSEE